MTGVQIIKATTKDMSVVNNLLQLYMYDLAAAIHDKNIIKLNPAAYFVYPNLERFWRESTRAIYLMKHNHEYVGISLVHQDVLVNPNGHVIGEFGVLRMFQNKGFGLDAARKIYNLYGGAWEMRVSPQNPIALKFWKKVLDSCFPNRNAIVDHDFYGSMIKFYVGKEA